MSDNLLQAQRPDFFGKDNFTPFVGQVEDVMDPNRSNRVKVRCVGWHPHQRDGGGDDSLSTEDLPWARVGMPVTHAQQARIGGKHGLQVGCWVMGFFVDGEDAQDPFVLCTFNQTAKTSEEDNRKKVEGADKGKLPQGERGFPKINVQSGSKAIAHKTPEEQGGGGYNAQADPAGDTVLNDETEGECGKLKSVATERQHQEEYKNEGAQSNAESDNYKVLVGDGRCGTPKHQATDMQRYMQELMPANQIRFAYGDQVWDAITGNNLNLNAGMNNLAQLICSLLKMILNLIKQQQEEKINRNARTLALAIPVIDARIAIEQDKLLTVKDDMWAVGLQMFINMLCQLVQSKLNDLNNGGGDDGGGGANPVTPIVDNTAPCLSEKLMASVICDFKQHITDTEVAVDEIIASLAEQGISADDYTSGGGGGGGGAGAILGMIAQFLSSEKFTTKSQVFHAGGDGTQDERQKECQKERMYDTLLGFMSGMGGGGGGGGGGGTGDGDGGGDVGVDPIDNYFDPDYPCPDLLPCEDAETPLEPDPDDDDDPDDEMPDEEDTAGITIIGERTVTVRKKAYKYECVAEHVEERYRDKNRFNWKVRGMRKTNRKSAKITSQPETKNDMGEDIKVKFTQPGRYKLRVRVNNPNSKKNPRFKTITIRAILKGAKVPNPRPVKIKPPGNGVHIELPPLPCGPGQGALNYIEGRGCVPVIKDPGDDYETPNPLNPDNKYPVVEIPGYTGPTPIPVISPDTGEFVTVILDPENLPSTANPPVTVIPSTSPIGITTDDPNYDVEMCDVYVQNTGRGYCLPTVTFIDKDTGLENGKGEVIVSEGRIVDIEITDTGSGFKRIPEVRINVMGKIDDLVAIMEEMEKRNLQAYFISSEGGY